MGSMANTCISSLLFPPLPSLDLIIIMIPIDHNHPYYSVVDNTLTIKGCTLPVDMDFVHEVGNITYTDGGKKFHQEPHLYYIALWLVGHIGNHNNYYCPISEEVVIGKFTEITKTDFEASWDAKVSKNHFNKVKRILKKAKIINYKTADKTKVEINGKTEYRNMLGTIYLQSSVLRDKIIDYPDTPITIDLNRFSQQDTDIQPTGKPPRRRKVTPKYTDPPISIRDKHPDRYSYDTTLDVSVLTSPLMEALKITNCGKLSMGHAKNKERLQAALIILELIYKGRNDDEGWVTVISEEANYFATLEEDYVPLSQERLLQHINNADQISKAKETLKLLGWIEAERSYASNEIKREQLHRGEKYCAGARCKAYRLTHEFFSLQRSSKVKQTYTIQKTRRTPYRVLQACSLDPSVFDIFDQVASQRNWSDHERSRQYNSLHNFDFHKGDFDQKYYSPDILNSRVYTSISALKREFRKYVLIDGQTTVEIDIKSAHALILAHFMDDPDVKHQWINKVTQTDIYRDIMTDLGLPEYTNHKGTLEITRDLIKGCFSAYINGATTKAVFNKKINLPVNFSHYMYEKHPELHAVIDRLICEYSCAGKTNNGAALKLQEIESDIMGTYFMCHSKFDCISIHDGLLCKESDAPALMEAVKERAREVLGFEVQVEYK